MKSSKKYSLAIIGCGKMSSLIAQGLCLEGVTFEVKTYNPTYSKACDLAEKTKGIAYEYFSQMPICDFYLLGAKPHNAQEMADMLKDHLPQDAILISILVGITASKLEKLFKHENIVRLMPNTPMTIGMGVNLFFSKIKNNEKLAYFVTELKKISKVYSFDDEKMIEQLTIFSGSGPAFIFNLAGIFANEMARTGVDAVTARELVKEVFLGSAMLMHQSDKDFLSLQQEVTSKNGVTYAALSQLKVAGMEEIFHSAFNAGTNRALELSQQ